MGWEKVVERVLRGVVGCKRSCSGETVYFSLELSFVVFCLTSDVENTFVVGFAYGG